MNGGSRWGIAALPILVAALGLFPAAASEDDDAYEVWAIDQSDTTADGGGALYIYRGDDLAGMDAANAPAERIDLGGAARTLCLAQTGTAPRRPHMFNFNRTRTHAVIAFVATGHVLFMDAALRSPVACIDVGVQAHAAVPSHDDAFVVVANQNGKLLQRIDTDYAAGTFTLNAAATLDLATCTTPSGAACEDAALRPNNRPICPAISDDNRLTFVTLAGGGLFVVDATATPMSIVAEYDRSVVHPDGCGGIQAGGQMYVNSGGPLEADLYSFPLGDFGAFNAPNTPAPSLVYTHDGTQSDSHGGALTRQSRFLWVGERFGNNATIVDTASNEIVNQFSLAGAVSADPAPDLMARSPSGHRLFMTLRGPNPLTGNNAAFNNAVGSTPGVGIIRVENGGAGGSFFTRIPISNVVDGVERADPHGIAVRPLSRQ